MFTLAEKYILSNIVPQPIFMLPQCFSMLWVVFVIENYTERKGFSKMCVLCPAD